MSIITGAIAGSYPDPAIPVSDQSSNGYRFPSVMPMPPIVSCNP
jgi:hypothetical protein